MDAPSPRSKRAAQKADSPPNPSAVTRRALLRSGTAAAAALSLGATAQGDGPTQSLIRLVTSNVSRNTELKTRAQRDYAHSMADFGGGLSSPHERLVETARQNAHPHYDVVVIGSGYGASICAARIATSLGPGRRMCILERGREWAPGTFPDTIQQMSKESRFRVAGPRKGEPDNPLGLFNAMINDDINVVTGSGLGGTSLINANIAMKPDAEVFAQQRWPTSLRDPNTWNHYFDRAAFELGVAWAPHPLTPKAISRWKAANRIRSSPGFFELSPAAVTYDHRYLNADGRNRQGVIQRPCTMCGDCVTGCNVGAKNILTLNYLPIARRCGAEIYTQCEVQHLQRRAHGYTIQLVHHQRCGDEVLSQPLSISARMVVLGAGSPGSVEILLRSRDAGLPLSPQLGCNWSGNGNMVGFAIRCPDEIHAAGFGTYRPPEHCVGPTVQTSMVFTHYPRLEDRILIQEASFPRAVTPLFALLLQDPELNHSIAMQGIGHDGQHGQVRLSQGRAKVHWPGIKESQYRHKMFKRFEQIAAAHGGRYKRLKLFGDNLSCVHPLGGCNMADDAAMGVVNDRGQVFADGSQEADHQGQPIHAGLYVADGSVVPTSLAANPYLTISALAERIAELIVGDPQYADLFAGQRGAVQG